MLVASLKAFFALLRFEGPSAAAAAAPRREPAAADAVCRYGPTREKENLKNPQIFQILKIK